MANWNEPTNNTNTLSVLDALNDKIENTAKMDFAGDTNLPTGVLRYDSTNKQFQSWDGATWLTLTVLYPDGTAAAPAISFSADTNTGIYRNGSDILEFAVNGFRRVSVSTAGLSVVSGQLLSLDGSAAAPGIAFGGDLDTGFFRWGTDQIAWTTNGQTRGVFSGYNIFAGNGTSAASPVSGGIQGTNGSGTNIAGANLTVSGGNSTGSAAGGSVVFQTAAAGSSGSSSNTLTERARVKPNGQLRFVPLAADPAGAEAGDVYYNSATNKLRVYNGTSWVDLH